MGEWKVKRGTDLSQTLFILKYPKFAVSDPGSTEKGCEVLHPLVHRDETVTQLAMRVASARGLFSLKYHGKIMIKQYRHKMSTTINAIPYWSGCAFEIGQNMIFRKP